MKRLLCNTGILDKLLFYAWKHVILTLVYTKEYEKRALKFFRKLETLMPL